MQTFYIRCLRQTDFFWLKDYNCNPLHIERDSIYILFTVHFSSTSYVAINREDDKPIGFLLGFPLLKQSYAYIHYLYTDAQYRKKGIGKFLVSRFKRKVGILGVKNILIFTRYANAFYKKIGFNEQKIIFNDRLLEYLTKEKKVTVMSLTI